MRKLAFIFATTLALSTLVACGQDDDESTLQDASYISAFAEGESACKVTLNKCNNIAEDNNQYPHVFFDTQGGADKDENKCLGLANVYHDRCQLSKNDFVKTEYFNDRGLIVAEANVRASTRCQIKYTNCPSLPGWNNYSFNEYQFDNSDLDQNVCMQRAEDYYNWCGASDNVVTSEFYKNYEKLDSNIVTCEKSIQTTTQTYQYKDVADTDPALLSLDVLTYSKTCKPQKLLVFVHGGGWVGGDKSDVQFNQDMIRFFLDRDFVFVSVNYRLFLPGDVNKVSNYNQAEDLASAVAWIHGQAARYNIDPAQTYLYGHSAGAHLVSLVGTDSTYFNNVNVDRARVKGIIASDVHAYGVPEAIKLMEQDSYYSERVDSVEKIFGTTVQSQKQGSPMTYLNQPNIPEFLILSAGYGSNGAGPQDISNQMSVLFKNELHNKWIYAWHVHFPDFTHEDLVTRMNVGIDGGAVAQIVEAFLEV